MKKRAIWVAWLMGLAVIAWTCSGQPRPPRSGLLHGADNMDRTLSSTGIDVPTMRGTA